MCVSDFYRFGSTRQSGNTAIPFSLMSLSLPIEISGSVSSKRDSSSISRDLRVRFVPLVVRMMITRQCCRSSSRCEYRCCAVCRGQQRMARCLATCRIRFVEFGLLSWNGKSICVADGFPQNASSDFGEIEQSMIGVMGAILCSVRRNAIFVMNDAHALWLFSLRSWKPRALETVRSTKNRKSIKSENQRKNRKWIRIPKSHQTADSDERSMFDLHFVFRDCWDESFRIRCCMSSLWDQSILFSLVRSELVFDRESNRHLREKFGCWKPRDSRLLSDLMEECFRFDLIHLCINETNGRFFISVSNMSE